MRSEEIEIRTGSTEVVHDLTRACEDFLADVDGDGLLHVWVPHATAGLAVLETGAGSDDDLLAALRELLPADGRWRHRHGTPGHGRDHVLPALVPPELSDLRVPPLLLQPLRGDGFSFIFLSNADRLRNSGYLPASAARKSMAARRV